MKIENKLIADFMGMTLPRQSPWTTLPTFNNSWDYLMPVVEKIEALGYEVHIWKDESGIITNEEISWFERIGGTKIENTYNVIIDFINHYNQSK